jgi:hypothetical protein
MEEQNLPSALQKTQKVIWEKENHRCFRLSYHPKVPNSHTLLFRAAFSTSEASGDLKRKFPKGYQTTSATFGFVETAEELAVMGLMGLMEVTSFGWKVLECGKVWR